MAKRVTSEDLMDLAFVSDPRLSADGGRAAAVVTTVLRGEGDAPPRYRGRVVLFDADGRADPRPFTASPYGDRSPRFSPRGDRLAYLGRATEQGKPQLRLLPLDGGESEALTDLPTGVSDFCWHPDGRRLAFVSRGDAGEEGAAPGHPRRITRLRYKDDGAGLRPAHPAQLHLHSLRSGRSRRLTDLPAGASAPAFSPDGRTLFFVGSHDLDAADRWRGGLYALDLRSRAVRPVVEGLLSPGGPVPSPDGRHLAFLAPSLADDLGSPTGVWVVPSEGGTPRLLTGGLDAAQSIAGDSRYGDYPQHPVWDDDHALIFNLNREGSSALARVDLEGGVTPLMSGPRAVTAFDAGSGRAVFISEAPDAPGELWLREPDASERRLSAANDAWREARRLRRPREAITLRNDAGDALTYWTMPPVRARADRALVVQVHGGPHANYGYGFVLEFQLLAARGYTVVYGNPRGGSSYGTPFLQAVLGDYGGGDARDVLAIADDALARHERQDAPLHLTGGSYGGFMTNWLVGHTDRFRSAVTQRSICNWTSFYGVSDIGPRFTEREVGGPPWADLEALWRQSPLAYAAEVTTPTLVIHAEEDHRCPIEQGEQWYVALKSLGRADTAFLRVPGEGHELSRSGRPDRRIARLDAIVAWFEEHA